MWIYNSNEMVRRALYPANPDWKISDQVVHAQSVSQPKISQGCALMGQTGVRWFIFDALQ